MDSITNQQQESVKEEEYLSKDDIPELERLLKNYHKAALETLCAILQKAS